MSLRLYAFLALFALMPFSTSNAVAEPLAPSGLAFQPAAVATPETKKAVAARLAPKAASPKGANVIVQIALPQPFQSEGRMPAQALQRQRMAIAQAQENVLRVLAGSGAKNYGRYQTIPAMAFRVNTQALEALENSPLVTAIHEDVAHPPSLASSTSIINAPQAWFDGIDGTGQSIVIMDTGIDGDHPFFEDKDGNSRIVAEACFSNQAGEGADTSLCPDGSGNQTGAGAAEAEIPACQDFGPQLCDHGTHVAGIAAGNGSSFDGVARNADIIAIQVFTRVDGACGPVACVHAWVSDQLAALDYINSTLTTRHTIASVNMSLGGGLTSQHCDTYPLKPAIDNLLSREIATVISTGNDGYVDSVGYPACISSSVSVGSTTDADQVSSFSNVADIMDLFAPGSGVDSAIPGGGYASENGTSMAAPHVAGAFAALKQAKPTATVSDILNALSTTGTAVTDTRSSGSVSKPRIDVKAALDLLVPTNPHTWSPGGDNDWDNAANWSEGTVPTCFTDVILPANTPPPTVSSNVSVRGLFVHGGVGFAIDGHQLRVCGDLAVLVTSSITVSNGELFFDGARPSRVVLTSTSRLHDIRVGNGTEAKQITLETDVAITGDLTVAAPSSVQAVGRALLFEGATQSLNLHEGATTVAEPAFTDGWSYADDNGDGVIWTGSYSTDAPNVPGSLLHARYLPPGATTLAADDWLFSPPIYLAAGVNYEISFNYGASHFSAQEKMTVGIGTAGSVAAMTTTLFSSDNISNVNWNTASATYTPATSGNYHVGFHARSDAGPNELAFDDLLVQSNAWVFSSLNVASGTELTVSNAPTLVVDGALSNNGTLNLGEADVAVAGTFSNNGRLTATRYVANGTTTDLLRISDGIGTIKHRGVSLTPDGSDLGTTTLHVDAGSNCTTNGGDPLFQLCYDLKPTQKNSATTRFWLSEAQRNGVDASAASVLHWNGSAWENASSTATQSRSATGSTCNQVDGSQCWYEAQAVSSYSPFIVGTSASGEPAFASYTVTPSASSNGSISPNTAQTVEHGNSVQFTVAPDTGSTVSVGGTCGGNLNGNTYTTDAITIDCSVEANFTRNSYTVTPSAGSNGSISPTSAQTVKHGDTIEFTVTPDNGYTASVGGTCGGSLNGNTYTSSAVTTDCTVAATFSLNTFSLGVTVSGLVGGSVTLQNNGTDDLSIGTDGYFTFDTAVLEGEQYDVTVLRQPESPPQHCDVANGAGVGGSGMADNITVGCATGSLTTSRDRLLFEVNVPGEVAVVQAITISNAGEADLVVGPLRLQGADPGSFSMVRDSCDTTALPSGEDCQVELDFGPFEGRWHHAQLQIESSDSNGPHEVMLDGVVVEIFRDAFQQR